MSLAFGGGQIPSTGLGNISSAFGPPNNPGIAAQAGSIRAPGMHLPTGMDGMQPFGGMQPPSMTPMQPMVGNIPSPPMPSAPQASGSMAGGIGSIFAQMDPQHAAAIRGIPQQAMQALHHAGMIHPDLMRHLYGGAQQ